MKETDVLNPFEVKVDWQRMTDEWGEVGAWTRWLYQGLFYAKGGGLAQAGKPHKVYL